MQRAAVGTARSLALLAWLSLLNGVVKAQITNFTINTGQEFIDAVFAWEARLDTTTLLLNASFVSLFNTNWPAPPPPLTGPAPPGAQLVVQPAPGLQWVVLDTAMKHGLLAGLQGLVPVRLANLTLVNQCELDHRTLSTVASRPVTSSLSVPLFVKSNALVATHVYTNIRLYGPRFDVLQYLWLPLVFCTDFAQVRQLGGSVVEKMPNPQFQATYVHPDAWCALGITLSALCYENVTFLSVDNPGDPLIADLAARGLTMPPANCTSGALVPSTYFESAQYMPQARVWIANDSQSLAAGLQDAARVAALIPGMSLKHAPSVYLDGTASLSPALLPQPVNITYPLFLRGPFTDDPNYSARGVMDVQGLVGALRLTSGAALFLQGLELTGLVARPLSTSQPAHANVTSVLPLAAVYADTDSSTAPPNTTTVYMSNVTLWLPAPDYQALRALALTGQPGAPPACVVAASSPHAVALAEGITRLSLADSGAVGSGAVALSEFVGWGIEATRLRLALQPGSAADGAPMDGCVALSSSAASQESGELSTGAIVGIVIGAVAFVVATLTAALLYARARGGVRARQRDKLVTLPLSGPPAPRGGWLHSCWARGEPACEQAGSAPPSLHRFGQLVSAAHTQLLSQLSAGAEWSCSGLDELPLGHVSELGSGVPAPAGTPLAGDEHTGDEISAGTSVAEISLLTQPPRAYCFARDSQTEDDSAGIAPAQRVQQVATQLDRNNADRVTIYRMLARGGCGCVYLATWRGLPVALKSLVFQLDEQQAAALWGPTLTPTAQVHKGPYLRIPAIMEAAIAASVAHPNLVATYHYDIVRVADQSHRRSQGGLHVASTPGAEAGAMHTYKMWLVQELCACSLAFALPQMINRQLGRVEDAILYPLLLDIALGLENLHSHNIVHGDLKPANVLLAPLPGSDPPASTAKLTDWGLSVWTAGATHVSNVHGGTPFYISPEVVYQRRISTASDVFSWGILLWELLSGHPPYQISPETGRTFWRPEFPRFTSSVLASCPQLAVLCHKCLKSTPEQRPTASNLVAFLRLFVHRE